MGTSDGGEESNPGGYLVASTFNGSALSRRCPSVTGGGVKREARKTGQKVGGKSFRKKRRGLWKKKKSCFIQIAEGRGVWGLGVSV